MGWDASHQCDLRTAKTNQPNRPGLEPPNSGMGATALGEGTLSCPLRPLNTTEETKQGANAAASGSRW